MWIKSKTVMNWGSGKKKEWIFCNVFSHLCFNSMYSVPNKLSKHIYFLYVKWRYFIHFCCLFLKFLKTFSLSLRSLSCKSLFIVAFIVAECNAECGCYALFNFGIKPVIEWYRYFYYNFHFWQFSLDQYLAFLLS